MADLQRTVYPHSGHPSAAGRAQDRVSSPAKDRRSANCVMRICFPRNCNKLWIKEIARRITLRLTGNRLGKPRHRGRSAQERSVDLSVHDVSKSPTGNSRDTSLNAVSTQTIIHSRPIRSFILPVAECGPVIYEHIYSPIRHTDREIQSTDIYGEIQY